MTLGPIRTKLFQPRISLNCRRFLLNALNIFGFFYIHGRNSLLNNKKNNPQETQLKTKSPHISHTLN